MKYSEFRESIPVRTCEKKYSHYGSYKSFLRSDFMRRCGYCNSIDSLSTYSSVFQIDHFVPKKKFEKNFEVNDYSNLVYSCPTCNRYKSDTWVTDNPSVSIVNNVGFLDPCDARYSKLFLRDTNGKIVPQEDLGVYIYNELRLYLRRHEILYKLEKLDSVTKSLKLKFKEGLLSSEEKEMLIELFCELQDYSEYLNKKDA